MPKKSYMNESFILNDNFFKASKRLEEGFLSSLANFVKRIPKFGKDKAAAMKKIVSSVANLNKELDKLEKMNRKWLPDNYPKLPRFTVQDFIK